ncbi:hypothetical protein CRYUN_Cryun10bG0163500 [Craigia yunnanensis]
MKLFSKTLTATDCLKRLSIPKRVLTSLPEFHGGHAVELQVRCETMEYWPLVCTIRRKGRYKKPVISKGWRKFVLGNNLNVDDKLTLHKEEDEESGSLHYRVEVKRATRPSRALFQSLPRLDHDVYETTSARSCKNVEAKRVPVVNCTDQTSAEIRSCSPLRKFGSVRGTDRATDETNNTLFKQFRVDMSDVVDVNNIKENSKSQYSEEHEREFKLFGAIVGGALLVGRTDTIDHKAYHNSVKQFSLSADGAELVNSNGQASLRSDGSKEETAIPEHFNLGLTVGGAVVHVHDQATSSTSFSKTDQRLGFELDMILGQSTGNHRSFVNLDLNLEPPISFYGE